jgi:hypothetical protein
MSPRRLALLAAALALAGCGGGGASHRSAPRPPRLPRALAQSWAREADAVAAALAAGDGCTAQRLAGELRTQVAAAATGTQRAAPRLLSALAPAVRGLPARITCNPPAPAPAPTPAPPEHGKHAKPHEREHGRGHGNDD